MARATRPMIGLNVDLIPASKTTKPHLRLNQGYAEAVLTAGGLPFGLQIIGPRFREDLLLAAAARYESARPWPRHCTRA